MKLIRVGVDFETYYDRDYTLRKLTTAEYIMDPRFEIIGVTIVLNGILPVWFSGSHQYLHEVVDRIPWERCEFVAHNAMFDGAILEWKFGKRPLRYFCTRMAARPYVVPATGKADLGTVLKYLNIPVTKGDAVHNFVGMRRAAFTSQQIADYGDYSKDDGLGSCKIAEHLEPLLPDDERELIDLTIKKFTRPMLRIDTDVATQRLVDIKARREAMLKGLYDKGVDIVKTDLTSRTKFAALLEARGVKVPKKRSAADPEEETFAFAKDDLPFIELRAHPDHVVQDLVEARLAFSSSMEESRLVRFVEQANLTAEQFMAVPLLYYGAGPGRLSGLDKLNLQNLPRVDKKKPGSGSLRHSLVAPPGHVVLAGDLSNIEARIVATLAGQTDMVEAFRLLRDLYAEFATKIYRKPIDKNRNPSERFVGKTCILGLGYGMGPAKFLFRMLVEKMKMTLDEAKHIVYLYRQTYAKIPQLWSALELALTRCVDPKHMYIHGPLKFCHERIILPNGMNLWYPGLRLVNGQGLVHDHPRFGVRPLWGGHILENVAQALARIIISTAELRLARAGMRAALQVHDELVYVVPETHVESCRAALQLALTAKVEWLPELPVACEIKFGRSYGDAK